MARPKKLNTDEMLRIIDTYYESCGNPNQLKFSLIEKYAVSIGIDIKAYDFKRDVTVRQHINDLKESTFEQAELTAVAYKNIDVESLLNRNNTKESLKNALTELDSSWRLIYENAAMLSTKNKALMVETLTKNQTIKSLSSSNCDLESQIQTLKRDYNAISLENRYLKKSLKEYLYPAIANEILKNEGILESVDTEVTALAMDALSETDMPESFSKSITTDRQMLIKVDNSFDDTTHIKKTETREETLLRLMTANINEGDNDA